jgi:hypothetical protein
MVHEAYSVFWDKVCGVLLLVFEAFDFIFTGNDVLFQPEHGDQES